MKTSEKEAKKKGCYSNFVTYLGVTNIEIFVFGPRFQNTNNKQMAYDFIKKKYYKLLRLFYLLNLVTRLYY